MSADNLSQAGWSWGLCRRRGFSRAHNLDCCAHRADGKRFVVRPDEKLTGFVELESAIRAVTS
ncbi:MAG: hypothetical protein DME85_14340 [Verrucomicrobia bacterium]|nr:MAG: hypothetical protein DME85_14340 [Verrucomicrobiota bacterium]